MSIVILVVQNLPSMDGMLDNSTDQYVGQWSHRGNEYYSTLHRPCSTL